MWPQEMLEGKYDKFIFDYLSNLDLQGKVVFEIGAHIGFHAMCFATLVGSKGFVYAFEPNQFNRARMSLILTKNPDLSNRIRVFDVAISNTTGQEIFYFSKNVDKGGSSGSFIASAHTYYPKTDEHLSLFEKETVKTVDLDDIASLIGLEIVPDIIKIDVEGAESSVLQGAVKMITCHRPLILMEIHSIYNMLKSDEFLRAAGYKVNLLREEPDGRCFIAAGPLAEVTS